MPRGYPDFFGSATFFKFGNLRAEAFSETIGAAAQGTLLDIAYKGKTYGGYAVFEIDNTASETTFITTLDGEQVSWGTIVGMRNIFSNDITQQLMRLTQFQYNGTDYNICLSMAPDITFDYQFKLEVINGNAANQLFGGVITMAEVA